jgi:O-antigen/teichoic acid export membrane protein
MPKFESRAKYFFNFGWSHGRYGDYWSFVHILTGIIFGISIAYLGFDYWTSFWVVLFLLFAYEAWEFYAGIVEDFENAFTDIVIGQIGFVLGFIYVEHHAGQEMALYALAEACVLALLLLSIGYRKFLKRRMQEVKAEKRIRKLERARGAKKK